MAHILKQRAFLTASVTFFLGVCGLVAARQLANTITTRVTELRLEQYANRIIGDGEASSAELRTVLAAVSASQHPACSNEEIRYFRALIFESEYLKDAGRMQDGNILCSADFGRLAKLRGQVSPDFTQQDGTEIYTNLAPYRNGDLTVITIALGNSFVVFTPLTRMHLEPAPLHYTEMVFDAPTQRPGRLLGDRSDASDSLLTTEGTARVANTLYITRCSIRFFNCVTAYAFLPDVVQANRGKFIGCIALGGFLAASFGLVFSLIYRRNKSLELQLRRAIRKDALRVFYQPLFDLPTGRISGAEALARWNDENGVAVPPDVFIRLAEERGFVGEITALVVRHVLLDFGDLLRARSDFRVSINVTAADLDDPEFLLLLDKELYKAGVAPGSLVIEITEGRTVRHKEAIEAIRRLRRRGHSVHIDDFGTGYSSLAYLHELSVDAIKIDKVFTQAIGTGSVTVAILPQILAMARALNLGVVVEGVETDLQASYFAMAAQPIVLQGWLFGRPAPIAEFNRLLAGERKHEFLHADASIAVQAIPIHAA